MRDDVLSESERANPFTRLDLTCPAADGLQREEASDSTLFLCT